MVDQVALYSSVGQFSSDLYGQVLEAQSGNLENAFLSPLSIYMACLLTMAGTAGHTLEEMKRILHIPPTLSDQRFHNSFGPVFMNQFEHSEEVELSLANRLFLLGQVNLTTEFQETISESYLAEAEALRHLSGLEAKRQYMNQWVSDHTKQKVLELIPPGVLTNDSVFAIVNALYYRGSWKFPFDKDQTMNEDFHLLNGLSKEIPMMSRKGRYPIAELEDLNATAIKLPFNGSAYDLLIILPNEEDGLGALLEELKKPGKLDYVLQNQFIEQDAMIHIPRFKLSQLPVLNVKQLLQASGLKSLFDPFTADLSKMTMDNNLFISDMLHKAVIEVDEEGATAAAATGVIASIRSLILPWEFRVDHPFFVAVTYNSTVPMFIGHIVEPEVN